MEALHEAGEANVDFVMAAGQVKDSEGHLQPADNTDSFRLLHASKDVLGTSSSSSSPPNFNILNNKRLVQRRWINFIQAIDEEVKENEELATNRSDMNQASDQFCPQKKRKEDKRMDKHIPDSYPKLDENNVGHSMLRKLGWKGSGGIGKHESGISDPVFLRPAKGRKGLGHRFEHQRIETPKLISDIHVPELTLYLPFLEETESENPVIVMFESCVRSNVPLEFTMISKKKVHGWQILLQNKVIATGYGKNAKKARLDAAKKALDMLQGSHSVIFKTEDEKRLSKHEVIPGLTIYYKQVKHEEVINESCAKCELPVDWWDDSGRYISGLKWTVMLLINSKQISIGKGNTKDTALKSCATEALRMLKGSHPVIYKPGFDSSINQEKGLQIAKTNANSNSENNYGGYSFKQDDNYAEYSFEQDDDNVGYSFEQDEVTSEQTTDNNTASKLGGSNIGHEHRDDPVVYKPGFDSRIFNQEKGPQITKINANSKSKGNYVGYNFEQDDNYVGYNFEQDDNCVGNSFEQYDNYGGYSFEQYDNYGGYDFGEDEVTSSQMIIDNNTSSKLGSSNIAHDCEGGIAEPVVVNEAKNHQGPVEPTVSNVRELTIYLAFRGEEKVESPNNIIKRSCDKCEMSFKIENKGLVNFGGGKPVYSAVLMINDFVVATGYGKKKSAARKNAFTRALECLSRTQPIIYENEVTLDDPPMLMGEQCYAEEPPGKELIPGLILHLPYRCEGEAYQDPGKIIEESCSACNISNNLRINNQMTTDRCFTYDLFIENKLVCRESGKTTETAKVMAYAQGLQLLMGRQPFIYSSEVGHTPLQKGEIIPGLILYLSSPEGNNFVNTDNVLSNSCRQCGVSLKFLTYSKKVIDARKPEWCIMLVINNKEIAKGYGISIIRARHDATAKATKVLIENKQPVA